MIKNIDNEKDARACDNLLLLLGISDSTYNARINVNDNTKPSFSNYLKDKNHQLLLGYFQNEKLVGFIYGTYVSDMSSIDYLYVLEEYRNRGIASALLQEFVTRCEKLKIKDININTYVTNKTANHLYHKLGFNDFMITLVKKI